MKRLPICAAFLVLVAACEPEPIAPSEKPDGGCEPTIRPGADAGGSVSRDYPTCCFEVGVPETGRILAIALGELPSGGVGGDAGWIPDAGPNDGGIPPAAWIPAHMAFSSPADARWVGTSRAGDGVALHFEVAGSPWTVGVEEGTPVPDPPAGGIDVQLGVDEDRFTVTRATDGALLLAWVRLQREWMRLDDTRRIGAIDVALSDACYGWDESGFGCGRDFLVYSLEASTSGGSTHVAPRATARLDVGALRYAITNRLVSQRGGGGSGAVCGDYTPPVFDADVVIESL